MEGWLWRDGWELPRTAARRLWIGAGTEDTSGQCCGGFLDWLVAVQALGLLL